MSPIQALNTQTLSTGGVPAAAAPSAAASCQRDALSADGLRRSRQRGGHTAAAIRRLVLKLTPHPTHRQLLLLLQAGGSTLALIHYLAPSGQLVISIIVVERGFLRTPTSETRSTCYQVGVSSWLVGGDGAREAASMLAGWAVRRRRLCRGAEGQLTWLCARDGRARTKCSMFEIRSPRRGACATQRHLLFEGCLSMVPFCIF